jgi:uncharacterized SAM-binding protein YcdF (DUF218 family)
VLRNLGRALLVLLAIVAVLFLARAPLLTAVGSYLVRAQPPEKADIVLVLAGDGSGNRILKGAELVKQGYASKVLVSGPGENYGFHECDLAIPFAVKAGFPESEFIHMENHAHSTLEEAKVAETVLRGMGARHILLVTSNYHTRRSGNIYRREIPDMKFTVVAAGDRYFEPDKWWQSREGQKTTLYEWLKTIAVWVNL